MKPMVELARHTSTDAFDFHHSHVRACYIRKVTSSNEENKILQIKIAIDIESIMMLVALSSRFHFLISFVPTPE